MLKNYNYILTIMLYPFILILSYLLLSDYIKGDLYIFVLVAMIFIFVPSFIMTLYGILDDILNSKSKWRIILVILFSIFYIPYYYTKHISKQEVLLGLLIPVFTILLSMAVYNVSIKKIKLLVNSFYENRIEITGRYSYISSNNLVRMDVDASFRCNSNVGDYLISCDRLDDDSFIGMYSYDITDYDEEKVKDIIDFHINQTIDYIKESGYSYETDSSDKIIKIYYNNMVVLLTENNYLLDNKSYGLVIIKEVPKELLDMVEFEKMIESIAFLNYNNGVSS